MEKTFRPFQGARWLRGNLHTHTVRSDGHFKPEKVALLYRRANYDFLALSDHRLFGVYPALSDADFLVIPAGEFSVNSRDDERTPADRTRTYHSVHFLADPDQPNRLPPDAAYTPSNESAPFLTRVQNMVDWGNAVGNIAILSHPTSSGQYEDSSLPVTGFTAVEIHNNTSHFAEGIGRSEHVWDALLRAGRRIWGLAVDDGHIGADYYGGWLMVSADELSIPAIASAIRAGSFYATTGPLLHDYYARDGKIHIACSPCEQIRFVQYEPLGKLVRSPDGSDSLTEASFSYDPSAKFVRVECIRADGAKAWSNPIFISDLGPERPPSVFIQRVDPAKETVPLTGQAIPTVGAPFLAQRTPLRHGRHYKGCLHAHTTRSDGTLDAGEVCRLYREQGYDFLSLTDHRVYTNTTAHDRDDFLVLPGIELDIACGSSAPDADEAARRRIYHLNGILAEYPPKNGLPDGFLWESPTWSPAWATTSSVREQVQQAIDFLRASGHLVILNHPQWSGNYERDVYGFSGLFAMEVYNHEAELHTAAGFAEHHCTYCLRNNMPLWRTATDDFHSPAGAFGGWVIVSAPSFTKEAIADALAKGRFYASTGPVIHDFWVDENDVVRLTFAPAKSVEFLMPYSMDGWAIRHQGVAITRAAYPAQKGELVMAKVTGFDGKIAWTNPILV